MFQFNKNAELLQTIEKQKDQLGRYESRLRDLVAAYKSLQNEKQALEASVKALTSHHQASPNPGRKLKSHLGGSKLSVSSHSSSRRSSVDATKQPPVQDSDDKNESPMQQDESKDDEDEESISQHDAESEVEDEEESDSDDRDLELNTLRHQLGTLTVSLSTVSEEKSKIVATYQAEKKKLKLETDNQLTELREELESVKSRNKIIEDEVVSAREKIRSQQEDREEEQSTHSIMLRELQKMVNDERKKNEQISSDLQDAKKTIKQVESESKKSDGSEKQIRKLTDELENVHEKLKAAKEDAKKPQPIVLRLQKEIAEIKASHRIQLEKEHLQFVSAEERLKKVEGESEGRVSSLENQVTQLSNQMGGYETSKTRDQILVRSLKERISQMETENSILAKQAAIASQKNITTDNLDVENMMTVDEIKEQIIKYKGLLKITAQQTNDPIDVTAWLTGLDNKNDDDDDYYQKLYLESQLELKQLKDEYEKYKVRAQNVLKTKRDTIGGRDNISTAVTQQQYQEIKSELDEVRERHFHLRSHCDGLEEQQRKLVKEHGEEMLSQHLSHQKNLESEKEVYSAKVIELEQEMRSQRERTVALLAEKDKEVQHLQAYSNACHREYQSEYGGMVAPKHKTSSSSDYVFYGAEDSKQPATTADSVSEIMNQGSIHDTTMIHYAEQMARKDVSINGLRRHKKQLELQIRQLQDVIMTKDEKNSREIAALNEKIANFNRSKSRENANLEYLKNVMFQYLTTDKDQSAKHRMLNAVTAILQFSPEETRKVRKKF